MLSILKKMPIGLKILVGGIPILLGLIYVLMMNNKVDENKKQFCRQGFSSIVVKNNKDKFTGRTTEFHLENGLKVYFWLSSKNTIQIGDSIQKKSNTYLYEVYRKDIDGTYKFYATFDFLQM